MALSKLARKKYFTIHKTFDMFIVLSECNINGLLELLVDWS